MFEIPGFSYERSCEGTFPEVGPVARAGIRLAVTPAPAATTFAEPEAICEDGIMEVNCMGTRFVGGGQCAELEPECGDIPWLFVFDPGTEPAPPDQCGCPMTRSRSTTDRSPVMSSTSRRPA